jgi:hypothetical protein
MPLLKELVLSGISGYNLARPTSRQFTFEMHYEIIIIPC